MAKKEALEYIENKIKKIENNSRYKTKAATIDINAPLVLIQLELEAKLSELYKIKELLEVK